MPSSSGSPRSRTIELYRVVIRAERASSAVAAEFDLEAGVDQALRKQLPEFSIIFDDK